MISANATVMFWDATPVPLVALHDSAPVPPAPVPTGPWPTAEIPMVQFYPPGMLSHAFTKTVLHNSAFMTLDGHDLGYFLPHVTIGPPSALLPMTIAFSSRAMNFSASTVQAEGKPVSSGFPLPMSHCFDPIAPPLTWSFASLASTAYVGMTMADILAGCVGIIASIGVDLAFGGLDFLKALKKGELPVQKTIKDAFKFAKGNKGVNFFKQAYKRFSWRQGLYGLKPRTLALRWTGFKNALKADGGAKFQELIEKAILGESAEKWVMKSEVGVLTSGTKSVIYDNDGNPMTEGSGVELKYESNKLLGSGVSVSADHTSDGAANHGVSGNLFHGTAQGAWKSQPDAPAAEPEAAWSEVSLTKCWGLSL